MDNAKNRLHELIKDLGHYEKCVSFKDKVQDQQTFISRATLQVNDGRIIEGEGTGETKKEAQIQACAAVLEVIDQQHRDLYVDWMQVKVAAQLGDSLIKLCAYLSDEMPSAEDKSLWLQEMESDSHMVSIFDKMHRASHPLVNIFGQNLGAKKKATWIEALIWQRFGQEIIAPGSGNAFHQIGDFLGGEMTEIGKEKSRKSVKTSYMDTFKASLSRIFSIRKP